MMSDGKIVSSQEKLEAYSAAFESFSQTIERLESSYADLDARFSKLNDQLQETNLRLQQALAEKETARSFLNDILSSVSSGILVYDYRGLISNANSAACRLFGIEEKDVIGTTGETLVGFDTRPEISGGVTIRSGEEFQSEEKMLTLLSGSEVPIAVSTSLMKDDDGLVAGAVEVFHDLTKIRSLESGISRVKALAALGEIAATIAHEVRNPLGGISGFASLLQRDLPDDHPGQRLIDKIIKGVENLNRSVTSLLAFSREIDLSPRDVELCEFFSDVVSYFKADINHDADMYSIDIDVQPETLNWRLDPEQFRQAVVNLLSNAVQAMSEGGSINISARGGDMLTITIADSGCGIGEDIRERIFTPFFTTKDGGTGLGLSTVKKIVEAHRGEVAITSTSENGTCFRLSFPR